MSIEHVSRTGKVYYLHQKPGKLGKPNYFFSSEADGPLVDALPAGYEIHENVAGQVFLRRIAKKLIADQELSLVRAALNAHAEEWIYKIEIKKNIIVIHETQANDTLSGIWGGWASPAKIKQVRIQHAHYQAVFRFILTDPEKRDFAPERFCFRGSVEDWIALGPPEALPKLLKKYVKHLGKESMFELF